MATESKDSFGETEIFYCRFPNSLSGDQTKNPPTFDHVFGVKFFGMDELITQSNISPNDYMTLYHLFTFDVSK